MKTFAISAALTLLAGLVSAAPAPAPASCVQVTFQGAPPDVAFYTRCIPTNGSLTTLNDPLSISHIVVNGHANCYFFGVDGSFTAVGPFQTVDVGPPQTQVSGYCLSA
ncbi:MAG: hypothetical protein Q9187_003476 [Circinaria calcarea]